MKRLLKLMMTLGLVGVLSSCETLNTGLDLGRSSGTPSGHRGGTGRTVGGASGPVSIGGGLMRGGPTAGRVARAALSMNGHKDCSSFPRPRVKCAQQASHILKRAGVPIRMDYTVNGLVAQLRRLGWRDGRCGPGAVRHTAGSSSSGRHIGVIDSMGRTIHNSGTKSKSCGILGAWSYPSWMARSRCLVPPR